MTVGYGRRVSQTPPSAVAGRSLPGRRQVLRGLALCLAGVTMPGCAAGGPAGSLRAGSGPASAAPASPSPVEHDIRLVRKAIGDEERLLGFCTAVFRRYPGARGQLARLMDNQRRHVSRLRASLTDLAPPVARTRLVVPTQEGAALHAVFRLSAGLRDASLASCQSATAGLLAELVGSVGASHAAAVSVLSPSPAGGAPLGTTPGATPGSRPGSTARATPVTRVEPLQICLAAEHAAVYAYGLLGGVVSAAVANTVVADEARSSYAAHRSRRDQLVATIRAAHQEPAASAPAYDVPYPVTGPDTARRLARYVEDRCATVYAQAVADLPSGERVFVSAALLDCAVRRVGWGGAPPPFPGLAGA